MNKLRLLLLENCDRNCKECCNKDWNLKNLLTTDDFTGYSEILLTGGEPLLKPELIIETCKCIRKQNKKCKIYLYTAKLDVINTLANLLRDYLDGITLTLHEQKNVYNFYWLNSYLKIFRNRNKSMKLKIFKGIVLNKEIDLSLWEVKKNISYIHNCPLPEYEIFRRLK